MGGKGIEVSPSENDNTPSENRIAPAPPPALGHDFSSGHKLANGFNPRGTRSVVEVLFALGVLVALGGILMFGGGILAGWATPLVPTSVDEGLGKLAQQQYSLTSEECSSPEAKAYVEKIAEPLLEALRESPFEFTFRVVDDETVNAFALPGGFVTVNRGLLEAAENGEEVAGVLAHEIQHASLRHGTKRMLRKMGGSALIGIVLGGTDLHQYTQTAAGLTSLSYDREQEAEADERGLALLEASGIDPSGLATFFQRLAEDSVQPPAFLSTHPDPGDRAALVKRARKEMLYRKLPSPQGILCHREETQW